MTDLERARRAQLADEAYTAAAELLATEPDAVQRALAIHHRSPHGRCAACGPVSQWPCAVATIAYRAAGITRPSRSGPD